MHESWHLRYPSVVGEPPSRRRVDTQLNGGSLIFAILLPLIEITGLVDRIDLSRLSHLPWLIGLSPNHLACPAESMYIKCILTFVLQTTKLGPTETSVPERACESCDLQLGHSLAFARNSRSALILRCAPVPERTHNLATSFRPKQKAQMGSLVSKEHQQLQGYSSILAPGRDESPLRLGYVL